MTDTDIASILNAIEGLKQQLAKPGRISYSVEEAAARVGVGKSMIYDEMRAGRLKAKKVSGRTIILTEDLDVWANTLPSAEFAAPVEKAEPQQMPRRRRS